MFPLTKLVRTVGGVFRNNEHVYVDVVLFTKEITK